MTQGHDLGGKGCFGRPRSDWLHHTVSKTLSQLWPRRWWANKRFKGDSLVALFTIGVGGTASVEHLAGLTTTNWW